MTLEAAEGNAAWADEEFGSAMMPDVRHIRRLKQMAAELLEHPSATVQGAFRGERDARAAYEFLENPRVDWQDAEDASHRACAVRCTEHPFVFVAIDGSSWTYTDDGGKKALAP
jgi:hypothetical protein